MAVLGEVADVASKFILQHTSIDSNISTAVDKRDTSPKNVQSLVRSVELASTVARKGKHASIKAPTLCANKTPVTRRLTAPTHVFLPALVVYARRKDMLLPSVRTSQLISAGTVAKRVCHS